MKILRISFALLLLLFQVDLFAADIVGQGWGDTEAAAKREALADISSKISITVRSRFKSTQVVSARTVDKNRSEAVAQLSENTVETNSELPILGAEYASRTEGSQVSVQATLETSKSLPLYEKRLDALRDHIAALKADTAKAKDGDAQYNGIMHMLTLLDEFRKLNTVAIYLNGRPHDPGITEEALENQLRAVTKQVDSLDLAAKILTAGMNEPGIYILPARTRQSNEVTPFAALLRDRMSANLKTALTPRDAAYMLIGQYQELNDGVDVTYRLFDINAIAQKTNSVHISKNAYAGLETTPKTTDFEQLLKAGVAVSGDLHVEVSSNLGRHDLLFNEGDEVEFFVKLNESGYFYVVGHTAKTSESNSYLVELHQAEGPRKFVYFVNADDANKWISIGKFSVVAPFGVEGIQVIASSKDLIDALPAATLDPASGLYFVAASPKEGVLKTRAIIKKFPQTVQTAETSLIFTTRKK
ncbi:hypothetical protein GALL_03380 [mine drainage metagenome]|uniref:DUF4384 domain-containing protein n=1 Tax=mine drainage metagenome TaxID=410659 RepID=A0A1J5TET9_9ZZZZ